MLLTTTNEQLILAVTKFFIKSFTDGKINQEAESDFTLKSLTKLILDSPEIFLGKGATEAAVLGNSLNTRVTNLETFAKTHNHPTAPVGPVSTGVPPLLPGPEFLSDVVKVR